MKKGFLSLICGVLLGGILSYFLLDYREQSMVYLNYYGEKSKIVHELDFDFISNSAAIIIGVTLVIFFTVSLLEKMVKK
ncbi:hypothetical protein AWM68_02120 [Fictibacillus phosphorivorans]|uniref:Uncharacterized protein n=1 Tax=Fictibacillus phosphorivorans TaxID=1221500 RepID=A0A161TIR0_9BACL|nr:hypothetical protein [Fictibacillus phosphorivorans]KZE69084.1 hypothetical protein AWM68_02120 [Fictibacillus phosphorivorans]